MIHLRRQLAFLAATLLVPPSLVVACKGVVDLGAPATEPDASGIDGTTVEAALPDAGGDARCACGTTLLYSEPGVAVPPAEGPVYSSIRLSIDETYVYFTVAGPVGEGPVNLASTSYLRRIPKAGGASETIANLKEGGYSFGFGLPVDDQYVYLQALCDDASCSLGRVPKTGGTVQPLVAGIRGQAPLVIDATHLYWYDDPADGVPSPGIQRMRKDGTGVEVLVPPSEFGSGGFQAKLALRDDDLYYTVFTSSVTRVRRVKKTGGPSELLAEVPNFQHWVNIAVNTTDVYFTREFAWPDQPAGVFGEVWSVPRTGGTPVLRVQRPQDFQFIGMTLGPSGDAFWGEWIPDAGTGFTFATNRWTPSLGVQELGRTGEEPGTNPPFQRIAVDDDAAYFTAGAGRIFRTSLCCTK